MIATRHVVIEYLKVINVTKEINLNLIFIQFSCT